MGTQPHTASTPPLRDVPELPVENRQRPYPTILRIKKSINSSLVRLTPVSATVRTPKRLHWERSTSSVILEKTTLR